MRISVRFVLELNFPCILPTCTLGGDQGYRQGHHYWTGCVFFSRYSMQPYNLYALISWKQESCAALLSDWNIKFSIYFHSSITLALSEDLIFWYMLMHENDVLMCFFFSFFRFLCAEFCFPFIFISFWSI